MKLWGLSLAMVSAVLISGCAQQNGQQAGDHDHDHDHDTAAAGWSHEDFTLPEGLDAAKYVLAEEPEGVLAVSAARQEIADGDEIAVVGRIGTDAPWIEGRAAFVIVDPSVKACSDVPGDNCPTPWDYCCATDQLPGATALVMLVDDQDKPLKADTRAILEVKELSTVVVQGKAQRDDQGNLTVLASGVYVKGA